MNRMRVESFYCDGAMVGVPGAGDPWPLLLRAMALSNDAGLDADKAPVGDPTEVALLLAAAQAGLEKRALEGCYRVSPRSPSTPSACA
jgi:Ca2+-transporting ATPase